MLFSSEIQVCKKCIMDTISDPDIFFDLEGICSYCRELEHTSAVSKKSNYSFDQIIKKIKLEGIGKKYDCLIGLSGGVDSSYLVYLAKKEGLRPLVIHYDNGWNSELAVANIEKILKKLDIDLYSYINDWEEYKDLQLSFFKASVVDIELITDQAITAIIYKTAKKHNIKFVLFGTNYSTESILPKSWYHYKPDSLNIRAIHKKFGKVKLKSYPYNSFWEVFKMNYFKPIESVALLDYINYNKEEVIQTLVKEFDWVNYGSKHSESIFTRFYQGYILPVKFKIDKRKAHYSSLINSDQLTRDEALKLMDKPIYNEQELIMDRELVLKKIGISDQEFELIMKLPIKRHTDYPSFLTRHYYYIGILSNILKKIKQIFKL